MSTTTRIDPLFCFEIGLYVCHVLITGRGSVRYTGVAKGERLLAQTTSPSLFFSLYARGQAVPRSAGKNRLYIVPVQVGAAVVTLAL